MNRSSRTTLLGIRWAEPEGAKTANLRDVTLDAAFDGKTFTLAGGRSFHVAVAK